MHIGDLTGQTQWVITAKAAGGKQTITRAADISVGRVIVDQVTPEDLVHIGIGISRQRTCGTISGIMTAAPGDTGDVTCGVIPISTAQVFSPIAITADILVVHIAFSVVTHGLQLGLHVSGAITVGHCMGCGDRPRALHQPVIQVIIIGKRGGHIEHVVADVVCCHHRGVTHRAIITYTGWRPTLTGDFGI